VERHPLSSNIVWCGGGSDLDIPFLYSSVNSGIDWNSISHIMPDPSTVWSIEFDPVDAATVYVGGGGFIKTMDGGQSWTHLFGGIVHEVWVDPNDEQHLWIAVGSSEIYETWDGGFSWKSVENPIPLGTYIWDIIWHENTETILLATTSGVYSYKL
jgi:photosystem II stability/assembly factor-like uncharacterized protein